MRKYNPSQCVREKREASFNKYLANILDSQHEPDKNLFTNKNKTKNDTLVTPRV